MWGGQARETPRRALTAAAVVERARLTGVPLVAAATAAVGVVVVEVVVVVVMVGLFPWEVG